MRNIFFVFMLITCLCALPARAQWPRTWTFHSTTAAGWIKGSPSSSFQLQMVNGMQKRQWFLGLGVGLDSYRFHSLPVFADTKWYLENGPLSCFLYADAGLHFVTDKSNTNSNSTYFSHYLPGAYTDVGLGYSIPWKQEHKALLVSAGWSYKRVTQRTTHTQIMTGYPDQEQVSDYTYNLYRLSFKLGIQF